MPCITVSHWSSEKKNRSPHHLAERCTVRISYRSSSKGNSNRPTRQAHVVPQPLMEEFIPLGSRRNPHPAPSLPPSGYSRCRCETIDACRRQKKGAALPTEPLPLTAGLLIQTLKALALSNPCFTLAAPVFSWQRPFDDNCSNNERWRR